MDFLDPERVNGKQYQLLSRDDNILCPKSVERCEQCRTAFCQTDKVIVKSVGVREPPTSQARQSNIWQMYTFTTLNNALKSTIKTQVFRYFIYLPHDYNNYKKMPKQKQKMKEEMARRPKRNYRAYANQASLITIF